MLRLRDGFALSERALGRRSVHRAGASIIDAFAILDADGVSVYAHGGDLRATYVHTIERAHEWLIAQGSDSPWEEFAPGNTLNNTLNEYQQLAARTLALNPARTPLSLEQCALELASEAGEAIGEIKRLNRLTSGSEYRPGKYTADELRERIADEIGDVLWAVAAISTALNFPLAEIAERNINKLRERVPAAFADTNNTPDEV